VRTYRPVKPKSPRDTRMTRAARLRGEGMSLRQIAAVQDVSYETVRRDLAQWDALSAPDAKVSHLPVTKLPPGGGNVTVECDSGDALVLSLRRLA
jgi:hypothetical protein